MIIDDFLHGPVELRTESGLMEGYQNTGLQNFPIRTTQFRAIGPAIDKIIY